MRRRDFLATPVGLLLTPCFSYEEQQTKNNNSLVSRASLKTPGIEAFLKVLAKYNPKKDFALRIFNGDNHQISPRYIFNYKNYSRLYRYVRGLRKLDTSQECYIEIRFPAVVEFRKRNLEQNNQSLGSMFIAVWLLGDL